MIAKEPKATLLSRTGVAVGRPGAKARFAAHLAGPPSQPSRVERQLTAQTSRPWARSARRTRDRLGRPSARSGRDVEPGRSSTELSTVACAASLDGRPLSGVGVRHGNCISQEGRDKKGTASRRAAMSFAAVVARSTDQGLVFLADPEGRLHWLGAELDAVTFQSLREATRAASRLPARLRAFSLPAGHPPSRAGGSARS
jgi:hypothetical protein